MNKLEQDLYDSIISNTLVSKEQLDGILNESISNKKSFLKTLLAKEIIAEEKLLQFLSNLSGIKFVDLNDFTVHDDAIRTVPIRVAWHYEFMPIVIENGRLMIASYAPLSIRSQDEIRLSVGHDIKIVLARKKQVINALNSFYGLAADTVERMVGHAPKDGGSVNVELLDKVQNIDKKADEASITQLVNQIIMEAHNNRATDIHIEPSRNGVNLRYRIDGKLHKQQVSDDFVRFLPPVLSRIKIMANLNIVEKRIPQDGRAMVKVKDDMVDLRISFMPTPHGESLVIRILPTKVNWNLHNLGLLQEEIDCFDLILQNSSGIVLLTGPTGSGKTTTLYSCIQHIQNEDTKILTIEDPIEYEIKDVVQIQVNPEVGLTFAKGLRSMLRQDPDVMMVGEIRDKETAEIAIRVALTGHLVLSTLHTNDAVSGITRLIDIGIPGYLIASTVKAFVAQRLIRLLCAQCKTEDNEIDPTIKQKVIEAVNDDAMGATFHRPTGCAKCGFTGYFGRTVINEILIVNDDLRNLIISNASNHDIKEYAVNKSGMRTLFKDGLVKVLSGITSVEEVLNACQDLELGYELNS